MTNTTTLKKTKPKTQQQLNQPPKEDLWPNRKEVYSKSLSDYGEKKNKKLTLVVTTTASDTIRGAIEDNLGEKLSISEMIELIARGGLKLVKCE